MHDFLEQITPTPKDEEIRIEESTGKQCERRDTSEGAKSVDPEAEV